MKTLTSLMKAVITGETRIQFWIHAISLDARVIIRPTEHTGAIWVLLPCKDKPREQGHTDLPHQQISSDSSITGTILPFWFLVTLYKEKKAMISRCETWTNVKDQANSMQPYYSILFPKYFNYQCIYNNHSSPPHFFTPFMPLKGTLRCSQGKWFPTA